MSLALHTPVPLTRASYLPYVSVPACSDFRCEVCGPRLATQLTTALHQRHDALAHVPFRVVESSHVGGHRWAGNVIVYPSGDWFGNVNDDAQARLLVDHYRCALSRTLRPLPELVLTACGLCGSRGYIY